MPLSVATEKLFFQFSKKAPVIESVDLQVPEGSAYGILGPNGAGKSTLMKLLLGLLRPDQGTVSLFGRQVREQLDLFTRVGALIEAPRLYTHLSGRDNLRVFATYRNLPLAYIDELLETVGIAYAANRLVRTYSTGMRQRLGIALALLPNPDLLVLDEPTNGLDPQGIAEIRRLLQRLHREEGKTVIISSHILSEIEQLCSHVGILYRGKLRFQGTLQELRKQGAGPRQVLVETSDGSRAAVLLARAGYEVEKMERNQLLLPLEGRRSVPPLIDQLRSAGIDLYQVILQEDRLEDYFLRLLEEGRLEKTGK